MVLSKYLIHWWLVAILAFVFLYVAWAFLTKVGVQIRNKDASYKFATYKIFDKWIGSFLLAIFVARIAFVLQQLTKVYKIGFFLLPYAKIHGHIYFLTYYPWRLFRINEGVDFILLTVTWVVLIVLWFRSMANKVMKIESSNEKLKHELLGKWFWGVIFLIMASIFSILGLYMYTHS